MKLAEIAKLVAGSINGDPSVEIKGVASVEKAKAGDLVFVLEEKYLEPAVSGSSSAIITHKKITTNKPQIVVENPRLAMAKILPLFSQKKKIKAKIGKNVSIGPFVHIGDNSSVGDNCVIHPNVTIYDNVIIGNNVIIHSGAVLGVDGYGFVPTKGLPVKIPQIGTLVIEDDVEIYAGVCIARGALGETKIGRGTKIDNLTHIAHNCRIGENCLIAGQVGFAGSVTIGNNVMIAGQVGLNGHIAVLDNCIILGKSGVTKNIPANLVVSGFPAQDHKKELQQQAKLRKLLEEK